MGRNVILDLTEGEEKLLQHRWWNEETIQKMIAEAGVKIPEPETGPPLKVRESPS